MAVWGVLAAVAFCVAGVGLYLAGQMSAGYDGILSSTHIHELKTENARLQEQYDQLRTEYDSVSTRLGIQRGESKAMAAQIHKLEDQRARLRQDLALFDNLFPEGKHDNVPSIRSIRIDPMIAGSNPSAWPYRALVMRGAQARGVFSGDFRLQVRYRIQGRETLARTPRTGDVTLPLRFIHYRRIEGTFQSPPGAVMLGAVAQVVENGTLVAESVFNP